MRLNKFLAENTGIARREADELIARQAVQVNGQTAILGAQVNKDDVVHLNGRLVNSVVNFTTVMLNKPEGYVSSRKGQGRPTIYELLPKKYHPLKPVGRLDQNSSGLLLLTNDGNLAHQMTHPKFAKVKVYEVELDRPLEHWHQQMVADFGVDLPDGRSQLGLEELANRKTWRVTMHEGRNRQIRRTFAALGYNVVKLHRTNFGSYQLGTLKPGQHQEVKA